MRKGERFGEITTRRETSSYYMLTASVSLEFGDTNMDSRVCRGCLIIQALKMKDPLRYLEF
jgi:hypothetical protein